MTYTVEIRNLALGSARHVGTFETLDAARDYARVTAGRSQKFVEFEIWTGTPKNPGNHLAGESVKGSGQRR